MHLCLKPRGARGIEPETFRRRGQLLSRPPTTGPCVLCGDVHACVLCGDVHACVLCGGVHACVLCGGVHACVAEHSTWAQHSSSKTQLHSNASPACMTHVRLRACQAQGCLRASCMHGTCSDPDVHLVQPSRTRLSGSACGRPMGSGAGHEGNALAAPQCMECMQEYCNGGSLQEALSEGVFGRRLWPRWLPILSILHGIASGMAYMHASRICHGDLNPNNVFLRVRFVTTLQYRLLPNLHHNPAAAPDPPWPCLATTLSACTTRAANLCQWLPAIPRPEPNIASLPPAAATHPQTHRTRLLMHATHARCSTCAVRPGDGWPRGCGCVRPGVAEDRRLWHGAAHA